MLWLIVGLLILLVSFFLTFLAPFVKRPARKYFHNTPSASLIDQTLPEEIFEHVLSFSDPLTLVRCHFVNKYWDYQASKSHINSSVLQNAIDRVRNLPEVLTAVPYYKWQEYEPNYPQRRRLADFALAQKYDKHLLEIKDEVLYELHLSSRSNFLLKVEGFLVDYPTFYIGFFKVKFQNRRQFESLIDYSSPDRKSKFARYELIVPADKCGERGKDNEMLVCRPVNPVKYLMGIIARDERLWKVLAILLTPLLVHDILYWASFMKIFNYVLGLLALPILVILHVCNSILPHLSKSSNPNNPNYKPWLKLQLATILVELILVAIFYPHSAEFFAFIAVILATAVFGFFASFQFFDFRPISKDLPRFKNKQTGKIVALTVALVIFMNDWSIVYRSILDRTLFYRLFWNTFYWTILAVFGYWHDTTIEFLSSQNNFFGTLREVFNSPGKNFFPFFLVLGTLYGVACFVTLYAPYWGYSTEI